MFHHQVELLLVLLLLFK